MKFRGRVRKITLGVMGGALVVAGCAGLPVPSSVLECEGRDPHFAERLDDLAALELYPAGAVLQEQGFGCGDSTGTVYAHRVYRRVGTVDEVVDFYRRAVPADGWRLEAVRNPPADPGDFLISGPRICFSRPFDGTTAILSVWFQSDFREQTGDLARDSRDFGLDMHVADDGLTSC